MTANDQPLKRGEHGYYAEPVLDWAHNLSPIADVLVVAALSAVFGYLIGWMVTIWAVIPLFNGWNWDWDGNSHWLEIIAVSGGVWPLMAVAWCLLGYLRRGCSRRTGDRLTMDTPRERGFAVTESPELVDRKVIQCNYAESTSAICEGARAYVVYLNPGNGHDRLNVLVRSRGGRWIEKWEDRRRLVDFRVKTLPPEHPLYGNGRLCAADDAWAVEFLARVTPREGGCRG